MKKLTALLILSLFGLLNATDITTLSQKLRPIICQNESIVRCDNQSYLLYSRW